MMNQLRQSHQEKVKSASFLSNLLPKIEGILFSLLLLLLPTQLGKHFWPNFAIVSGIRIDYLSPTFFTTDILVVLLFFVWVVNKVQRAKFKVQSYDSKLKVFSVIILFLLFNIVVSNNLWNGFYHLLKFLEFSFVAYYVASIVRHIQQVKKIFFLLGIGVIGESILAIVQFLKQGSVNGLLYFFGERTFTAATPGIANASVNGELLLRSYGTFSHPNVLAGFLLISMICLLFSLSWAKKGFEKIFWITTILIGSSALLLTMSRLAFSLWVLLLISVLTLSIRKNLYRTFSLVLCIASLVVLLFGTPFGTRILHTSSDEESVVVRETLIDASGALFMQQPVIGIGLGNFIPKLATVEHSLSFGLYLQPVHNIFLLVLVETGIIGFSFFIWFIIKTYKQLFYQIRISSVKFPYRIFTICLSIMLLLGLFDHYFLTLQQGQLFFGLIVGLSWSKLHG